MLDQFTFLPLLPVGSIRGVARALLKALPTPAASLTLPSF
jgi:hypothetical protein